MSHPSAPSWCEECRKAEAPKPSPWSAFMLAMVARMNTPSPTARMISAHGQAMAAILGAAASGPTPYERHRREYERTGDPLELERALRHPLPALERPPVGRLGRTRWQARGDWLIGWVIIAGFIGAALGALWLVLTW